MSLEFYNPQKVVFDKARWVMNITVTDDTGKDHEFVASAGQADASGLVFSTREEYEEDLGDDI